MKTENDNKFYIFTIFIFFKKLTHFKEIFVLFRCCFRFSRRRQEVDSTDSLVPQVLHKILFFF